MNQFLAFTKPRSVATFKRIVNGIKLAEKRYEATPYPEDKIEETQSSACFRSMLAAMMYYDGDYKGIKQKEAEGLIQIGHPRGFHSWNKEGRAIIFTPEAMKQQESLKYGDERRIRILRAGWDVAKLIVLVKAAQKLVKERKATPLKEVNTKKALLELVEHELRPWTEELPYCYQGKPYYTEEHFEKEEEKKANKRVAHFSFKGKEFWLARQRRVRNSLRQTHWGMEDSGTENYLFDNKLNLISLGSLWVTKKEILTAVEDSSCVL